MCTKTTWTVFKQLYGNELWQVSPYLSSIDESKKIENNGEVINKSQIQKLFGAHTDYELKYDRHIETLYERWEKIFLSFLEL